MKKLLVLLIAVALTMVFTGCNRERETDDTTEIMALINGTYAGFFNSDGTAGSGEPGSNGNATASQPASWWRTVDSYNRIITVSYPSEGTAIAEVEDTIYGTMYVDRTFDLQLNPDMREFVCKRTKYAEFQKSGESWYLTGLSLGRWAMTDDANQKVRIVSMRVKGTGYDQTFTDPTVIIPLDSYPTFTVNSGVEVTLVTTNSSTSTYTPKTFGYLHHPPYNRDPMIEGPTNTFIESFPASDWAWGWGFAGGDAVDSQTLMSEAGPDYNWDVWVMPFRAQ